MSEMYAAAEKIITSSLQGKTLGISTQVQSFREKVVHTMGYVVLKDSIDYFKDVGGV